MVALSSLPKHSRLLFEDSTKAQDTDHVAAAFQAQRPSDARTLSVDSPALHAHTTMRALRGCGKGHTFQCVGSDRHWNRCVFRASNFPQEFPDVTLQVHSFVNRIFFQP